MTMLLHLQTACLDTVEIWSGLSHNLQGAKHDVGIYLHWSVVDQIASQLVSQKIQFEYVKYLVCYVGVGMIYDTLRMCTTLTTLYWLFNTELIDFQSISAVVQ